MTNDVGLSDILDPLPGTCETDAQRVSVRIKNYGTTAQVNVPIHLKVSSGNNTVLDITTVYPGTLPALSSAIYTFQTPFTSAGGTNYVLKANTSSNGGDQDAANDAVTDTMSINAGSETVTGEAEICGTNPATAGLRANVPDSSDAVFWFNSPTAATPIASGVQATTKVISPDNTYYLGLNELADPSVRQIKCFSTGWL
ncbi:MAG: hypothetical protein WDM78_13155 [Puia sp.]